MVYVTPLMLLLPVRMNIFGLIEWICQYGVHPSEISSSKDSVNVAFVQGIMSYSYDTLVNTAGITNSIDATLAYDDDNFWAHIVSEKGTKCNENNLMSFCLAIVHYWLE